MGGFFSPPKSPPPAPLPALPDTAEEDRKRRVEMFERRRRGRAGTIVTSARGLLGLSDQGLRRKSLLGE